MDFVDKVFLMLKEKGWSQYKLIKKSGESATVIRNMLQRKTNPSYSTIISVCNAFEMTLSEFFYNGEEICMLTE